MIVVVAVVVTEAIDGIVTKIPLLLCYSRVVACNSGWFFFTTFVVVVQPLDGIARGLLISYLLV